MLCDNCKKNEATVHMTRVVNGKKSERHLCNACAKQQGEDFGGQGFMNLAHPYGTMISLLMTSLPIHYILTAY